MGPTEQDGWGDLAKSPDMWLIYMFAWSRDGKKSQGALPGGVKILTSCCLLFIFFDHIPCLRQCSGNSATSEQVAQSKFTSK